VLLTLYNDTAASGNPSYRSGYLPGGAGVETTGVANVPFIPYPRIEPLYREVLDVTQNGGLPTPAVTGNVLSSSFSSGQLGAAYWSIPVTAQGAHSNFQFGIVFKPGSTASIDELPLGSGVGAEVCVNGPVQALCITPTAGGAITPGTLLCTDGAGNLQPLQPPSTPPTPTVTSTGGSATTWSYALVAISANGTYSAIGTAGTTTTGAATLSATAYNTITWTPAADALGGYLIVRTVAGTSPNTVGTIGSVNADVGYFVDNGLAIRTGTSATQPQITPAAGPTPTVTQLATATAGTTTYSYTVAAIGANGVWGAAGTAGSTATGNATLSAINGNQLTWTPVAGAVAYAIQRTVGGATQGLIGTASLAQATSGFIDAGQTATTYAQNTTPNANPGPGVVLARSLGSLMAGVTTPTLVPVFVGLR